MACSGQKWEQTPQPSQASGSTRNVRGTRPLPGPSKKMASKRHNSSHLPQAVQWPGLA
jgi:hypothetical protein